MNTQYKTRAQQRLERLESLDRPLTDEESEELRKALHAVYTSAWRHNRLAGFRSEELKLLDKMRREARLPERYPHQ